MRFIRKLILLISFRNYSLNSGYHHLILILQIVLSITALSFTERFALSNETLDIEALMKANIESARIRVNPPLISITDEQLKATDPNRILEILAPYEKDHEWPVRNRTHISLVKIANLHSENIKIRQEVVNRLTISAFNGTDSGAEKLLIGFTEKDFSESSKALIRQEMGKINKEQFGETFPIVLCSIANIQEELPRLKDLLIDEIAYNNDPNPINSIFKWYYTKGWKARLARARMGVKEDIIKCIELAESVEDPNERVEMVLPFIGYIRQKETIEHLKKYLDSNDRLRPEDGLPGPTYGSWVVHILAESLENFPIKQKLSRRYTDEEVALCRKWMSEQKEWKIIR